MSVRIVDTVASASVCSSSILHLRGEKIKKGSLTQKKKDIVSIYFYHGLMVAGKEQMIQGNSH